MNEHRAIASLTLTTDGSEWAIPLMITIRDTVEIAGSRALARVTVVKIEPTFPEGLPVELAAKVLKSLSETERKLSGEPLASIKERLGIVEPEPRGDGS